MAKKLSLILFVSKEKKSLIFIKKVIKSEHPSRMNGANKLQGGSSRI